MSAQAACQHPRAELRRHVLADFIEFCFLGRSFKLLHENCTFVGMRNRGQLPGQLPGGEAVGPRPVAQRLVQRRDQLTEKAPPCSVLLNETEHGALAGGLSGRSVTRAPKSPRFNSSPGHVPGWQV